MKTQQSKIKVYQFDGLSVLLKNKSNSTYLVVLRTEPVVGQEGEVIRQWYQIPHEELPDTFTGYFREKFGFSREESEEVLEQYNSAVRNNTFEKLTLNRIERVDIPRMAYDCAYSDEGIILCDHVDGHARVWLYEKDAAPVLS